MPKLETIEDLLISKTSADWLSMPSDSSIVAADISEAQLARLLNSYSTYCSITEISPLL